MPDKFEELMSLHDGELPDREKREVQSRLDEDPEARELLEKLARADGAFADAAEELLELSVPPKLVDAVYGSKVEIQEAQETQAKAARVIPFPRRRRLVGLAVAAGLAAVIATNMQLFKSPSESPNAADALASLLQVTLESVPSGEIADSEDGTIRITPVLTFRTASAEYCREFLATDPRMEISGVACRNDRGQWVVASQRKTLLETGTEAYLAAEGESDVPSLPPDVVKTEELSYSAEQQAIGSNWSDSRR